MVGLILTEACVKVVEHLMSIVSDIILDISFEELLLELGLILTDMQKIKTYLRSLTDSPVLKTVKNFQDAIFHLNTLASNSTKINHKNSYKHTTNLDNKILNTLNNIEHINYKINNSENLRDDAKKYFNQAIITSREAMSISTTNLDHYFLCMQIQFISKLSTENFQGVKSCIRNELKDFILRDDVKTLYSYLFYYGAEWNHKEMKFAYSVYKMMNRLKLLSVVDDEFERELKISVNRSIISPISDRKYYSKISNPKIKLKTTVRKVGEVIMGISFGIVGVPLSLIYGTLQTATSISLSPIALPCAVLDAYVRNETNEKFHEDINDRLSTLLKYGIGSVITAPKRTVAVLMDQTVGIRNFFLNNSPPDGYITLFIE